MTPNDRNFIDVPEFLSRETCAILVGQLKTTHDWIPAQFRKSPSAAPGSDEAEYHADQTIRYAYGLPPERLGDYMPLVNERIEQLIAPKVKALSAEPLTFNELHIVRYPIGGFYREHSDVGPTTQHRQFTLICYLSTHEDSGETWFPELDCQVQPVAGRATVFPSRWIHSGRPVRGAEKYILAGWFSTSVPG